MFMLKKMFSKATPLLLKYMFFIKKHFTLEKLQCFDKKTPLFEKCVFFNIFCEKDEENYILWVNNPMSVTIFGKIYL